MALTRQVVSTLTGEGIDVMGPTTLAYHYPDQSLVSGSLLTVEANHFAVLKSRGAVLGVYDTGQYPIQTPDKPVLGSFVPAFFGGQSPWQYEVLYVNRAKLLVRNSGVATSAEMAEMSYQVEYYIHVDTKDGALKLVTHMPFANHFINTDEVAGYAGPVVEQSINQIVQVTPMEKVNEKIHDIVELVKGHLGTFLDVYGITLNDAKVLIVPKDERMRELISLRAFGLSEIEAVRYYLALKMAEQGLVSAPNAAVGQPYFIGGATMGTYPVPGASNPGTATVSRPPISDKPGA
jgi:membrane protease subunit (stomatin/prohibitin family)